MPRIVASLCLGLIGLILLTLAQSSSLTVTDASIPAVIPDPATLHALQTRYRSLSKQLNHLMPSQPYIVVDTARNHLYIKRRDQDRKSTRLNSSHSQISYAVFCLKKKK